MDMGSRPIGGSAVPHGSELAGRDFGERRVGVLDAGVVEGLLPAPLAARRLGLVAKCHASAGFTLRRTVVVDVDVRSVAGAAEIALRLGVVQFGLLPGDAPGMAPVGADAGIGARGGSSSGWSHRSWPSA